MDRKAQSMQINVIIMIILAVITLIIIISIFHRQILKSEKKVEGVSDPLEVRSRCLSTWKNAGYTNYDDCVTECLKETDRENPDCYFPK